MGTWIFPAPDLAPRIPGHNYSKEQKTDRASQINFDSILKSEAFLQGWMGSIGLTETS